MKSIIDIGMDVYKKTYSLCAVLKESGEVLSETKISADPNLIIKLAEQGIDCDILAPSTMQRSAKNKVLKNDRRDARNIAVNLANGTYKSVHIPTEEDIEIKEYIRMMHDFKIESKKIKQHINAFILRFGHQYPGKSRWVPAHIKWLKELKLNDMHREILDEYLSQLEILTEKIERFQNRLEELSQKETYREKIG